MEGSGRTTLAPCFLRCRAGGCHTWCVSSCWRGRRLQLHDGGKGRRNAFLQTRAELPFRQKERKKVASREWGGRVVGWGCHGPGGSRGQRM
eukprot:705430-Prorocentrum_lima.AAC.1